MKSILAFLFSLVFSAITLAQPLPNLPTDNASFTPAQQAQIEQIVHTYLVAHPEVLVEASNALQQNQMKKMQEEGVQGAKDNLNDLLNNPTSPVAGNPNGPITLIAFLDYQCVHCRDMAPILEKLVDANSNLRVVFKEFPIFGPDSVFAAKAAIAAAKQGKYFEFHNALMTSKNPLTNAQVLIIAKNVGLNINQLKKDMKNKAMEDELQNNYALAKKLNLIGTPAFIVTKTDVTSGTDATVKFFPGATTQDNLQNMIDEIK